jgi:hypothetical protein
MLRTIGFIPTGLCLWSPLLRLRIRPADHSDGDAVAGVADRLLKGIRLGMHNEAMADDAIGAGKLDHRIVFVDSRSAIGLCSDVSEIAHVAAAGIGGAVRHVMRVEVSAGRQALGFIGDVAELVNVKSMFAGSQTADLSADVDTACRLVEDDRSRDAALADGLEHANRLRSLRRGLPHSGAGELSLDLGKGTLADQYERRRKQNRVAKLHDCKPFLHVYGDERSLL